MCYRIIERYSVCKCVYFTHGVDQCNSYGTYGHRVVDRDVLVGHTCPTHVHSHAYSSQTYGSSHSTTSSSSGGSYLAVQGGIAQQHAAYTAAAQSTSQGQQQVFRGQDGRWYTSGGQTFCGGR